MYSKELNIKILYDVWSYTIQNSQNVDTIHVHEPMNVQQIERCDDYSGMRNDIVINLHNILPKKVWYSHF